MKALLFSNYGIINGALVDVLDYYITILTINKNIKLYIINYEPKFKKELKKFVYNRYGDSVKSLPIFSNIVGIKKYDLLRIKFNVVLLFDYGTLKDVKGFVNIINDKSKILILSDLHTDIDSHIISKKCYPDGCVEYYGEMPYVYKDHQYTMKMLLKKLRKPKKANKAIFLHSPYNEDYSFLEDINLPDKPIIYKTHSHKYNLFESFDTYVYYHANKWFDPRPRLFAECYYFEKEILYFNVPNIKDGSYYRYNDLMHNGIEHRHLDDSDEIIQQFKE